MYDTIVIGKDLSSLIAALTAVRRGLKTVLVLEDNQDQEYRESGYTFQIDPTPFSGFGHEQTLLRLLLELHPLPYEAPQPLLMDPAFQVILPNHRIDLFNDPHQLVADMIREFPQNEREILRFYKAIFKSAALVDQWIMEDGVGERPNLKRLIRWLSRLPAAITSHYSLAVRGNGDIQAFIKIIETQLAFLSHLEIPTFPLPLSAAYLLSLPAKGIFSPSGGRGAWINWLRNGFTHAGGVLVDNCSVIRIDTKPQIIVDLENAKSPLTFRSKKLIVSAQWEKVGLLLDEQKIFRRLVSRFCSSLPTTYPFFLHLGVREGGLPEKMAPLAIVVRDKVQTALYSSLLILQTSPHGATVWAPEGRRAISATVFLGDSPLRLNNAELKEVAMGIIESLEGFLPFLRQNIDYVNIEKSIALSRQYQESVNQKYRTRRKPYIGINTLSPKTPLRNVFITGGILRPGLGFEGEILSGMDAAFFVERELQNHG